MATIKINGTIESSVENGKVVKTTFIEDEALAKTQAEINQEANDVVSLLPTEETSGTVANLVKNASGYGVKLSSNFTVGSDGTIGISVDTSDIDLADYYKKTETYSQSETDSAIATAVKTYNDTTGVNLSNKIAANTTNITANTESLAKKGGYLATAYGASNAAVYLYDAYNSDTTQMNLLSSTSIKAATTTTAGVMSATDKTKLDGLDADSYAKADDLANYLTTEDAASTYQTAAQVESAIVEYATNTILDTDGKIRSSILPSYVDDVIEGTYVSSTVFNDTDGNALTAESGKIYVDTTSNQTYRWSGSQYVVIGTSLALGTTSSTAFAGDRGLALETKVSTIETNLANGVTAAGGAYVQVSSGIVTKFNNALVNNAVANYVEHSGIVADTAGIKKITVDEGAVASVEDAALTDITAFRGAAAVNAAYFPVVYVGISSGDYPAPTSSTVVSEYTATSYYINTSEDNTLNYKVGSTTYYSDGYIIPTLKVGDILVESGGDVWMVTKALDGTNPVQVANISQLRTSATTVSLTQEEYDALETAGTLDSDTVYVIKD